MTPPPDLDSRRMILHYQYADFVVINQEVPGDQLGPVLMKSHELVSGKPLEHAPGMTPAEGGGYSNFLGSGAEIRTITGADPKRRLAVPLEGGGSAAQYEGSCEK